jgi:hypothetical protein
MPRLIGHDSTVPGPMTDHSGYAPSFGNQSYRIETGLHEALG